MYRSSGPRTDPSGHDTRLSGGAGTPPGPSRTRNRDTFDPQTLYWAVSNIFREYNTAHPGARVKPHNLRKRASTLTTVAAKSVDETARAVGIDPQTVRRYYLDAERAFDSDAPLTKMAHVLDPARPKA
jgi:hypothetical protein